MYRYTLQILQCVDMPQEQRVVNKVAPTSGPCVVGLISQVCPCSALALCFTYLEVGQRSDKCVVARFIAERAKNRQRGVTRTMRDNSHFAHNPLQTFSERNANLLKATCSRQYLCIFLYIYRERERERRICIYIYIYIYIYLYICFLHLYIYIYIYLLMICCLLCFACKSASGCRCQPRVLRLVS